MNAFRRWWDLFATALKIFCGLAVAMGLYAGTALSQEVPTDPPPNDRWTFALAPYLWGTSLDGEATVGGVESDVDVSFRDILEDISGGIMALGTVRKGDFGFIVNGLFARVSPDAEVGPFEADVTTDLAQLTVAPFYRAVEWQYDVTASGRPLLFVLEPYGGARLNYLRTELEVRGGQQFDENKTWVDPIVGSRFGFDVSERWLVAGAGDVGGVVAGSDISWNVQGYLGYRTSLFGKPTLLAFGYRALHLDYDDDDFKWDVTQHGPIVGASFRF